MTVLRDLGIIALWEVRGKTGILDRRILLPAIILLVFLIFVSNLTSQTGLHLNDGLYTIGVTNKETGLLFAGDSRFNVEVVPDALPPSMYRYYDLVIVNNEVFAEDTVRGHAAVNTLLKVYDRYKNSFYADEPNLFAAYPLWIDISYITSPVDFTATQSGQAVRPRYSSRDIEPRGPVQQVNPPDSKLEGDLNLLRRGLTRSANSDSPLNRYRSTLGADAAELNYITPSQFSQPLPFDTIILIFVFIFPLYFVSQFFMMTIMDERIGKRGEPLLSTPIRPSVIVIGKAIPYFCMMVFCTILMIVALHAPIFVLFPLIPVMLFFLSTALLIGISARSFKELSFLSIFFSTIATSYLFFPSIFAHVHVVSMVSPVTLVILTIEKTGYSFNDYLFSTSLFYLAAIVIAIICIKNYREEQLFSQKKLFAKIIDFLTVLIVKEHPFLSLAFITMLFIPLVFMIQLFILVIFFNLPMPLSLVLILIAAAFTEEVVKSLGLCAFNKNSPTKLPFKSLILASIAVAAGFLIGEKLLLFITLSQITESVFGSVIFTSLGSLIYPFLLHFGCTLIVALAIQEKGKFRYGTGIIVATIVHCSYNAILIRGWLA